MIGQKISHYEILEKLGSGGMGSVYKAKDLKLDRFVAIKFLNKELLTNKESHQRFINEAKTVSSLDHPNIAVVHEIDEFEDSIFICMGFYEGETLQNIISQGPLPLADVYSLAIQIAQGLAEAHQAGVVHRDVKPANIMVTKSGQVKILDFGLSKAINLTELTRQDTILGTAAYMSPEQIQGKPLDHLTDVFSFGIMLYEMTTGERPFSGEYGAAVSYSIMHEEPPPVRNYRPEIPDALEDVILKALSKEEPERYQSATEIERDFKAIQSGDSVKTSLLPKIALTTPRKRTWVLAGSILMLGLIFFLFTVFRSSPKTSGTVNSVLVLPFIFEGSEQNWSWLGGAMTELINTNLAQYNSLQVSGSRQGAQIMRNMGIENLTNLSKDDLKKIARAAKIKSIVSGSLIKMGNKISTRATVLQTDNGDLLRETKRLEGEPQKLNELAANLSSQLVTLLKIETNANNIPAEPTQSLEAFRFFLEGKDAALDNRFPESIDKLQKAITFDLTFASAYRWLAYSLDETGDYAKAKKVLTEGKPYITNLSEEMRLVYLLEMAQYDGRWKDYVTYLEQLLHIKPFEAGYHFKYGWVQLTKFRRFEAGIVEMEKALQLDSTSTWIYNHLAFAYLENGNQRKGFENIEKYISLNPTDINPLDSKAEMQMLIGQYNDAISNFERSLAMQPDFLQSRIMLTRTYVEKGENNRALYELNQYFPMAKMPKFKSIGLGLRAEIYFLQGELDTALETIEQAIARDPKNVEAHWIKGNILLKLQDKHAFNNELVALDDAQRAQGGLDGRWFLYNLEGENALIERKFEAAISSFKKALDLRPRNRSYYLTALAKAYEQAGKLSEAIQQYDAALEFNPNYAWAVFGIANLHEKLGEFLEAKKAYKRVLEIWSEADEGIAEIDNARDKISKLRI